MVRWCATERSAADQAAECELKIPPTVQGILAARIDRLPADAKELLQTLAVIGTGISASDWCAR